MLAAVASPVTQELNSCVELGSCAASGCVVTCCVKAAVTYVCSAKLRLIMAVLLHAMQSETAQLPGCYCELVGRGRTTVVTSWCICLNLRLSLLRVLFICPASTRRRKAAHATHGSNHLCNRTRTVTAPPEVIRHCLTRIERFASAGSWLCHGFPALFLQPRQPLSRCANLIAPCCTDLYTWLTTDTVQLLLGLLCVLAATARRTMKSARLSLFLAVVVLSAASCNALTWESCNGASTSIKVAKVEMTPDPPTANSLVKIRIQGTSGELHQPHQQVSSEEAVAPLACSTMRSGLQAQSP
jgi:hypothetical protein